ncbi:MAG: methylated-DNA--[protein]-cysteine S-methyltransferase [Verrucomicrobiaceae bacterium]|nr:methylated-DNA--[protein]-cysteine S-methyltransferase [Verrucomicrobiaceae bacterium]
MNDYERVARIIRYLDAHQKEQPGLDVLAAEAGLSESHFHRLFSRWAGVTPKDFLQCLTAENARERLRRGESVLDAALGAGLSSPGRLHDLCVTLEAATPGEIKAGGEGWEIVAGFAETPFGLACIANGPRGLCHLAFVESEDRGPVEMAWPKARFHWSNATVSEMAVQIFQAGKGTALKAFVRATPFQLRVWRALLRIPPGAAVSYGHLAKAIGSPKASRAVGTAVGANPLAYLIPCHRVIRETGIIGQYRWGHERKCVLLGWEWCA